MKEICLKTIESSDSDIHEDNVAFESISSAMLIALLNIVRKFVVS